MITSQDFDRVVYKKPQLKDDRKILDKIIGLDTEAYETGEPFMVCTSLKEEISLKSIPEIFFFTKYVNANFILYNIKYDSGALLYHLSLEDMHTLWEQNEVKTKGYKYQYIPHKMLRISKNKQKVTFWDIAQFYKMSLDKASQFYLNQRKLDIRTKKFTEKYVKRFRKSIREYCIRDATLTKQLADYFLNKLVEFGITPTAIYSCASIAFKHFCDTSNVITSWYFWKHDHRKLLALATDAYEGGKFEVTARGKFTGYEYDLTSAYPYEIKNLVDISKAKIIYTSEYQEKAVYGYLRCEIDNNNASYLPCGIMKNNIRIYPTGKFYLTITKQEYDYLQELNISTKILDGAWLQVKRKRYPYRKVIDELFKIKAAHKNKDKMIYNVSKIIMNSFYGKCVQCIETPDKKINIGAGWNPMYGAVITANTRIKVTRMQNLLKSDCLAVHTDSIITKKKIPEKYLTNKLGDFEYVIDGKGYLIACGMYQIKDQCAFKGFKPKKGQSWESLLSKNYKKSCFNYPQLHVESWVEAMAKNHGKSTINLFSNQLKQIDLNCDTKRNWMQKTTGEKLLTTTEESLPKIHIENNPPEYWKI